MTLLGLIQEFCRRQGLTVPGVVAGSSDDTIVQLMGLANEVCDDLTLVRKISWTQLQQEITFTTIASADQGAFTTLFGTSLIQSIVPDTMYNRTTDTKVQGPVDSTQWQAIQAVGGASATTAFRLRGGHLLMTPTPVAGHTIALEIVSTAAVESSTGTAKQYFTADTDVFKLPPALMLAGLRWMWRDAQGLPYAEQQRTYDTLVEGMAGADKVPRTVRLDSCVKAPGPGILVSPGSWNL